MQVILIVLVIFFTINKFWFLLVGSFLGLFYLGIIGSSLHPLQTAVDLAKGPLNNPVAKEELETISRGQSNILVGNACTRVGILLGFGLGVISFSIYHITWFIAIIIGIFFMCITASILKVIFRTMA